MADDLNDVADLADALADARETIEHLKLAVQARQRVGEAVGILMERYTLDRQAAFAYLCRVSSHTNTKIRDVAAKVVAETEARDPQHSKASDD